MIEGERVDPRANADATTGEAAQSDEIAAELPVAEPPIAPPPRGTARPILSAAIGALVGAVIAAGGVWFLN